MLCVSGGVFPSEAGRDADRQCHRQRKVPCQQSLETGKEADVVSWFQIPEE